MHKEKRKRLRVPFETRIHLVPQSGEKIVALTRNICMNGVYVQSADKFPLDTFCHLEIVISAKNSALVLHIDGNVRRIDLKGMGMEFHADMEWWALFCIYEQYGRPSRPRTAEDTGDSFLPSPAGGSAIIRSA